MKIKIEVDESLTDDVLTIQCRSITDEIVKLQQQILACTAGNQKIMAERNEEEYYLDLKEIIFMEADNNQVAIHTCTDVFWTRQKLYELEELLPRDFLRISKSSIVNTRTIKSIKKNITGPSEISFVKSTKNAYASRNYIKALMDAMEEKRLKK